MFLAQLRLGLFAPGQICFQTAAVLANLCRLLLGSFSPLALFSQRFAQLLDLLLYFRLRPLEFLKPCFELRPFGSRVIVLSPLFKRLLQLSS